MILVGIISTGVGSVLLTGDEFDPGSEFDEFGDEAVEPAAEPASDKPDGFPEANEPEFGEDEVIFSPSFFSSPRKRNKVPPSIDTTTIIAKTRKVLFDDFFLRFLVCGVLFIYTALFRCEVFFKLPSDMYICVSFTISVRGRRIRLFEFETCYHSASCPDDQSIIVYRRGRFDIPSHIAAHCNFAD